MLAIEGLVGLEFGCWADNTAGPPDLLPQNLMHYIPSPSIYSTGSTKPYILRAALRQRRLMLLLHPVDVCQIRSG